MTVKAIAAVAMLGLLALPLLARPGNRGRAGATVQTSADEVYTVNTADDMMDMNAAVLDDAPATDARACQPGDGACLRDEKDIQAAMRELEALGNEATAMAMNAADAAASAVENAVSAAENAASAAENEAGPERRR